MDADGFVRWAGHVASGLQAKAAAAAANAMAAEFHRELTDVTLRQYTHPRGAKTTSPPGETPALVTGTMRRSARIVPAQAGGPHASARVRVGVVYARIQEKGGVVRVKRAKFLRFTVDGKVYYRKSVRLPARPYMAPTRRRLVDSGLLERRAAQAVAKVAREAARG